MEEIVSDPFADREWRDAYFGSAPPEKGDHMVHKYHPQAWDPILAPNGPVLVDGCPRCEEHAEHPGRTLDATRQARLRRLAEVDGPWHSTLDVDAARRLAVPGGAR